MKIRYSKVDEHGFFVGDIFLPHIPEPSEHPDLVAAEVPSGLYLPRWDGEQWVEGLSQEEIDAIVNVPAPPNASTILGERIVQLELENLQLKQQNEALGSSLIDFELRLLQLEGGNV